MLNQKVIKGQWPVCGVYNAPARNVIVRKPGFKIDVKVLNI